MIQLQTLNKILKDGDSSFITLNNLGDEFFSDYLDEFHFIKDHLNNYGKVPDIETFLSKFPNFEVLDVKESSNYLLDALFEDRNKRFLASTFNSIRKCLNENKVEDAMRVMINSQNNLSKAIHLNSVSLIKDTSRYDKYVERSQDFSKFYVRTGFKELDQVIGGWDKQEELATIFARPNVGKSFILFKIAIEAAKQGLNVGIYSGEMSETKVGYRIDTLLSHISNTSIIHGNLGVANDYKKYIDDLPKNIKGDIKVITPVMIGGMAGVNALKAFIEKENLDMLCIDQHSLLDDDRKARNPVERAANISKDLKNLQVLKKIPIIAVSQRNREDKGEEGDKLSTIAQSDRIGQDSTVILCLEQKDNVMTIELAKSRDSAKGQKLKYFINLDRGLFEYVPTDKDALSGSKCESLRKSYEENIEEPEEDRNENVF